jgi:ABC-2 type transport system permease protein
MKTNIAPVYWRELKSIFYSPIAYIVMFMFALLAGYFFASVTQFYANYSMQMMAQSRYGQSQPMKLMEYLFSPYLGNLAVTFLFILPLISMRMFSEEKKSGTIELLFTYPLSDLDILLGKYLAGLTFLAVLVAEAAAYPLLIADLAPIQWGVLILGIAGLALVGAAFLALGTFTSALSENQVVAGSLGFGSLLLLFVLDWVAKSGGPLSGFLSQLSVMSHFGEMPRGILNLSDVSYFILFFAICLFSTLRVLESKKWR